MAKQSKKKQSPGQKAQFLVYATQGRAKKNKTVRLARHVRANPNDAQSANATASGHVRKAAGNNGPVVIFSGFRIIGEKTVKSRKTGKTFKVPVFESVFPKRVSGFNSNACIKKNPGTFGLIENRVGVTAAELKAGLGF